MKSYIIGALILLIFLFTGYTAVACEYCQTPTSGCYISIIGDVESLSPLIFSEENTTLIIPIDCTSVTQDQVIIGASYFLPSRMDKSKTLEDRSAERTASDFMNDEYDGTVTVYAENAGSSTLFLCILNPEFTYIVVRHHGRFSGSAPTIPIKCTSVPGLDIYVTVRQYGRFSGAASIQRCSGINFTA